MQQAELIIAYINGQLPEKQLQEFEQQLVVDLELQSALKDYQIILEGFKGMKHQAFQAEVAAWEVAGHDDESLRIMDYLEGRLEKNEKKALEERMAEQPDIREKVEEYRTLMEGFKGLRQTDFAAEVREWAAELPAAGKQESAKTISLAPQKRSPWLYAAAAALLILIAASIWLLGPYGGASMDLTAYRTENYIEPAPASLVRGQEEAISRAGRAFAAGDYAETVTLLQPIAPQDSLYVQAQYFLGHAYYQTGQFERAINAFTNSLDPPAGKTYDLRQFDQDNAGWTRILAQFALWEKKPDGELQQKVQNSLREFLEKASRTDVYYQKGLDLQERLNR